MENKKHQVYLPIFLSIALILGLYLGSQINFTGGKKAIIFNEEKPRFNKIAEVLNYIEREYVDTVNRKALEEKIIQDLLQELDPHSYYISAEELQAMNEPIEGSFDGIGIEFRIQKDTITVVSAISGGPSEKTGLRAGDRIVYVDSVLVAGTGIKNQDVMKMLRGKRGTKVIVEISRKNEEKLIPFEITRDKIPIHSLEAGYLLNNEVGFIKLSRFSKNTHKEFVQKATELENKGMKKLILDLRGNGGGLLDAAIKITDEFLQNGKLIVYTEGKARSRDTYYATNKGSFESIPVVVLIDESSASASEIVAGAIQDNDRGIIIGRRSFGKGLVQEPSDWPDGSAIRLTIARYYTPTGRCIQKPYEEGSEAYHDEYYERIKNGELQNKDSIQFPDSLKYKTPEGKIVYGGGGIMPDKFVPIDTIGGSYYLSELVYRGIFYDFSFAYADNNRDYFKSHKSPEESIEKFKITEQLIQDFVKYAENKKITKNEYGFNRSKELIKTRLKASILRNIWGNDAYYPVIFEKDNVNSKALEVLSAN